MRKLDPLAPAVREVEHEAAPSVPRPEPETPRQRQDESRSLRLEVERLQDENMLLQTQVKILRNDLTHAIKVRNDKQEAAAGDAKSNSHGDEAQHGEWSSSGPGGTSRADKQIAELAQAAQGFAGGIEEMMWCKERTEMLTDELEAAVRTIGDQGMQIRTLIDKLNELGQQDFTQGFSALVKPEEVAVGQAGATHGAMTLAKAMEDVVRLQMENADLHGQVQSLSEQRTQLSSAASVFAEHAESLTRDLRIKSTSLKRYKAQYESALETIRHVCDAQVGVLLTQAEHIQLTLQRSMSVCQKVTLSV
jgi:chromosome segregation ATPase